MFDDRPGATTTTANKKKFQRRQIIGAVWILMRTFSGDFIPLSHLRNFFLMSFGYPTTMHRSSLFLHHLCPWMHTPLHVWLFFVVWSLFIISLPNRFTVLCPSMNFVDVWRVPPCRTVKLSAWSCVPCAVITWRFVWITGPIVCVLIQEIWKLNEPKDNSPNWVRICTKPANRWSVPRRQSRNKFKRTRW